MCILVWTHTQVVSWVWTHTQVVIWVWTHTQVVALRDIPGTLNTLKREICFQRRCSAQVDDQIKVFSNSLYQYKYLNLPGVLNSQGVQCCNK